MNTIPCFPAFICTGLILSGCAQFQHQTREDEPHGVVFIGSSPTSSPVSGMVRSLDGQPVREGSSYRVRPGNHEIVVEFVERTIESANPVYIGSPPTEMDQPGNLHISESGGISTTGVSPYQGMQPLSMSVENRTRRQQIRNFPVAAGRKYVISGTMISEERPVKP
jgi:hypothetical protein